jgi:hypothetical protein
MVGFMEINEVVWKRDDGLRFDERMMIGCWVLVTAGQWSGGERKWC